MSAGQPPQSECKWCGEKLAEGAEQCPLCRRPVAGDLRPVGDAVGVPPRTGAPPPTRGAPSSRPPWERPREQEPVKIAAGQGPFGSLIAVVHVMRGDALFAVVLVLLALNVVGKLLTGRWLDAVIAGAILWGIITFRRWGYLVAMFLNGLALLLGPFAVVFVLALGGGVAAVGLLLSGLGVHAFCVAVLYARRDHFR